MSTKNSGAITRFIEKVGKRRLVIVCSVLLVGLAVYLNYLWFYTPDTNVNYGGNNQIGGNVSNNNDQAASGDSTVVSDYFSSTELSRKQARDEALEVLQTVVSSNTATEATKDKALEDISQIALDIQNESAIETLVIAKGFEQCVAVISNGLVSVVVESDGLLPAELAQIYEIVYQQTGIIPENVTVIEKTGT